MIQCMIVDDEPYAVNLLEEYICQLSYLHLAHKCYHALEALDYLKQHTADLIFLDINMPQLNGMQLATLFKPHQKFIFVTAYADFALESYEKNAVDYLLKPVTFERFLKAIQKATSDRNIVYLKENTGDITQSYFIKSGRSFVSIRLKDIIFIEGLKDYVLFHTASSRHTVYKRMKDLAEMLPDCFIRVHNSYIVNTVYIEKVQDNHIFLQNTQIAISDKYKEAFLQTVNKHLL